MYLNRLGLPSTYFTPVYLTTNYPSFLSLPPPLPPLLLLLLLLPPVPALSLPTTTTTTLASRPQRYRPSPAAVNKMSSSGIFQIDMPSSFAPPVVSISTPRPADNPLFCVDTSRPSTCHPPSQSPLCAHRPTTKPIHRPSVSPIAELRSSRPIPPPHRQTRTRPPACPSQTPAPADGSQHTQSALLHLSHPPTPTASKSRRASSPTTATASPSYRTPTAMRTKSSPRPTPLQTATTTTSLRSS